MTENKINVLIIDDEEQILKSFKAHFRTFYNVFTAKSTAEGMIIIQSEPIHVVLCDYKMPGKDGVLFFSELVITHPNITRILITAFDYLNIAIEAINVGCTYRYVQKPWNLDELKITIDQSYSFYKLKDENAVLIERLMSNERLIKLLEENQKA